MMYGKVKSYIEQYKMLEGTDYVIAGLSGGVDSVCLLFMLREYISDREKGGAADGVAHGVMQRDAVSGVAHGAAQRDAASGIAQGDDVQNSEASKMPHIIAVHVHHGIRGVDADADAEFCRNLCRELDIEYRQYNYNVPEYAAMMNVSEEEAGRKLRYEAFAASIPEGKKGVIAVAHHQDDQAETVLFHLVRGSFLKGSRGMRPVSGNIIRPLLCVGRVDIEKWAFNNNISYCTDMTNFKEDYARNRIRLKVMPYLEENINSGSSNNLCRFAAMMSEVDDYLELQTKDAVSRYVKESRRHIEEVGQDVRECGQNIREGGQGVRADFFMSNSLTAEHIVIQRSVAYKVLYMMCGGRDLERKHADYLLSLYDMQCDRSINLPDGIIAKRIYDGIDIGRQWNNIEESLLDYMVTYEKVKETDKKLLCDIIDKKNINDYCTKYFDYDKIKNYMADCGSKVQVELRHRRQGDYMIIDAAGHKKKLKEFMIDNKVPSDERDGVWLFAVGSNVIWVVGIRRCGSFLVDECTRELLKIEIRA